MYRNLMPEFFLFKNSKASGKGVVIDWVNESLSATVYVGCESRTIRCQNFYKMFHKRLKDMTKLCELDIIRILDHNIVE